MNCGVFIQSYCTLFSITYNGSLFIIILEFVSTVLKIEDGNIKIQEFTGQIIGYETIKNNATNCKINVF